MTAIDTNVAVYAIDRVDAIKRAKARALLRRLRTDPPTAVLLWQVIGEFPRYLRSRQGRGLLSRAGALRYFGVVRPMYPLAMPTPAVLDRVLDLSGRYSLSHWDSMLIGACVEAGIDTLYTEDMGAPVTFDGIRLINPFA